MTRKLLILLATFVVLLVGFLLYRQFLSQPGQIAKTHYNHLKNVPMVTTMATSAPTGVLPYLGAGTQLRVESRNSDRRLKFVLEAPQWSRSDDGGWALVRPAMSIYQEDGTAIYIRGETGKAYAEEVNNNLKVNSGTLQGGVEIIIDRGINADPATFDSRPEDIVRIEMQDVAFDNNRLQIHTLNEVKVTSFEADVEGKGLTMFMNESPSELRLLRLEQGRRMTIKSAMEGMSVVTPGAKAPSAQNAAPAKNLPASMPAPAQSLLEQVLAAKADGGDYLPPPDAAGQQDDKLRRRNIYFAQFDSPGGDMTVNSSSGHLEGASRVSLLFDWGNRQKSQPEQTLQVGGSTGAPRTQQPRQAKPAPVVAGKATVIEWNGPLELKPIAYTPSPNRKRYEMMAQGPALKLSDAQAVVHCSELYFLQPNQTGRLLGSPAKPVKIDMDSGERIESERVVFDRLGGWAEFHGKGRMTQPFKPDEKSGTAAVTSTPAVASGDDTIDWTKSVRVLFGNTEGKRQHVKEATFTGHVQLRRPTGDFMACDDNLHVEMGSLDKRRNVLKLATAVGNVSAQYEGNSIVADRLVMNFEAVDGGRGSLQMKPSKLDAYNNVCIEMKGGQGMTVATADEFHADAIRRTAVLNGKPAKVIQGPNLIIGNLIRLNDAQQAAQVVGEGMLEFPNDTDPMSGARLVKPTLVRLNWSRSMNYSGRDNKASFLGDVRLNSEMNRMNCGKLDLEFSAGAAKEQAVADQPSQGLALGIHQYGSRQISKIIAEEKVSVDSRSQGADNNTERILTLFCNLMVYEASSKLMTVTGYGRLGVWDFRPPDAKADNSMTGSNMESPSLSAFEWQKLMTLSQDNRTVLLEGQVQMHHYSGKFMKLSDKQRTEWNVADWGQIADGRQTILGCQKLLASFDAPPKNDKPALQDGTTGPRLGAMRSFQATEDVNLSDGPYRVLGQRLIYDGPTKMLRVFGYLQGQREALAQIVHSDEKTGRVNQHQGPEVIWNTQTNEIEARKVRGSGGR